MTVILTVIAKSESTVSNGSDPRPDRSSAWASWSGSVAAEARLDFKWSALDIAAGGAVLLGLAVSTSCLISFGPLHSDLRLVLLHPGVPGSTR
jgi:hypothetical protein